MLLESHNSPLHIASVTLAVRDLAAMTRYYEAGLGLAVIDGDARRTRLGVDGELLLTLVGTPGLAAEHAGSAGLFHTAFLLPSRAELGAWMQGAMQRGLRFTGMSDHSVSEALYLDDPEGNGIEVYADRPRAAWQAEGSGVVMATAPLDRHGLLAEGAALGHPVPMFPTGSRIGHIHLRVGNLAEAETFYGHGLGLAIMHRRPQARFFSAGGYHHHIATNTWVSEGAGRRPAGTTGIVAFEIAVSHRSHLAQIAARQTAGGVVAAGIDRLDLQDPWGLALGLQVQASE